MADPYGTHEAKVYYVQEVTYGTTPSPNPAMLGLKTAFDVDHGLDMGVLKLRGIGSRDLDTLKKGLRKLALKFGYLIPSTGNINFLQYAQNLNSMSIEVIYEQGANILALLYKGAKIDRVTVQLTDIGGEEAIIKVPNVELIAQNVVTATSKNSNDYTDYSGAVAYNESYVKKDTVAVTRVTDWTFNIDNHLKRVPVIRTSSGDLLKYLRERQRDISGEVTFEFESKEEHDETLADTEFTLEFGLGGSNKVIFSNCKWTDVRNVSRLEDLVAVRAPFVARQIAIS